MSTTQLKNPGIPISRQKVNVLKDSAIMSLNDFHRIRANALFTPEYKSRDLRHLKTESEELSNDYLKRAQAHKNKILDYDRQLKSTNRLKTLENNKRFDPYQIVGRHDDAVQAMEKICLYAKIATIRDRQLDERKVIEDLYKKKEEKLDLMVELERLKEIKHQKDVAEQKRLMHEEGRKIIVDQIKEGEKERIRQRENLEKERIQMIRQLAKQDEEEKQKTLQKKLENEARVQEGIEANKQAILLKQKKKLLEKEEDLRIEQFNREKMRKEEEYILEKKRLALEKEKELQILREKQEKAADKQAELDALRAKRAYEETERKAREKEKEEIIIQQRKIKDLIEANEKQKLDKEMQLAEEAKKEKEEFDLIIKEHQKALETEKENQRLKIQKLLANTQDLKKQISLKQEKEKVYAREVLEEGRKIKQKNDQYVACIEAIRQEKLGKLRALNIKDKYIAPLQRFTLNDLKSSL